jgi:acyl-homoserine lactone acylase PvdQ
MHWVENGVKKSLSGATMPGSMYFLSGENEHISWGFSKIASYSSDLFLEEKPVHLYHNT